MNKSLRYEPQTSIKEEEDPVTNEQHSSEKQIDDE
jgi:hypothetical protein